MDRSIPPVFFGEWIKQRRKVLDLTQEELAQRAGYSKFALRKIESGERRPSKQLAELLAKALEIPPDEQQTFIRVARGETTLERLRIPSLDSFAKITGHQPASISNRIPLQPTPLLGRDSELAAMERLFNDQRCRLLTLTGMGGIGKTRLAIEFAIRQQPLYPEGVFYIPLAPINSSDAIVPTIADVFGFVFSGPNDPKEQLINYITVQLKNSMLLVLDNFEHLLVQSLTEEKQEAVGLVSEFLQRLPNIKILATSRERLNLQGEWTYELHGLTVPPQEFSGKLEDYSAAALFIQNALRKKVDFELTIKEQTSLIQVCQVLDGNPLAIELAAAWAGMLSCQEILEEINSNIDFLTTSMQDVSKGHRSMRAVFNHSWKLLSEDERRVLLQLSIFRGGFQREAAEQVAGADLSLLSILLDKSLLGRTPIGRYEIHELLRQYAEAKQSEKPGEFETAWHRYSAYYGDVVQRLHDELISVRQAEALAETSVEMDNIRAAWQYAVNHELVAVVQRFVSFLWHFYEIRGWFKEGYDTFQWAEENMMNWSATIEKIKPEIAILHADLRAHYAWFCLRLGQWGEASRLTQESVVQLRSLGAWNELAEVLHLAGVALWGIGQYDEARVLLEEKIALDERLGQLWDLAMGTGQLGLVYQGLGDYCQARDLMRTAQRLIEESGDQRMIAVSFFHRASVEFDLGELDAARELLEKSLALSTVVGDRWTMGTSRFQLGLVSQAQGEHEQAIRWFHEAQEFYRETGEHWSKVRTLNGLGTSLFALGDDDGAGQAFREALSAAVEAEIWPHALEALVGISNWQAKQGAFEEALITLEQVVQHPACNQNINEGASRLRLEIEPQLTTWQVADTLAKIQEVTFDMFVSKMLG